MKHISILVPNGPCSLVNIDGTYQILVAVNGMLAMQGSDNSFQVQLVSLPGHVPEGRIAITPDATINDVQDTDLIIIPAAFGEPRDAVERNRDFIPWIKHQYARGAEVASFCIGAFLLAETGLLNGKQCSTHWQMANTFRSMYPHVIVADDRMVTEENGLYTSGGAYAYLNLLLYLIEKYAGRTTAILVAKTFAIDIDRFSQSPFMIFNGQKEHNDVEVRKAQEFIEKNFHERISVDQLADMLAVGRRSFERRFKRATSNTVIESAQRVKIEAAKRSFETSRKNINEVMYDVGYTDSKGFREVFKKMTGLTPVEYRNKYSK